MSKWASAVGAVVESLEMRQLLHAGHFHLDVNFQPAGSVVPAGYVADSGQAFGERGNGYSYGWDAANTSGVRERNKHADQRYDTLNHMQAYGARTWEVTVPNGQYQVHLVAGDADYFNSVYKINVEGMLTVNGTPTSGARFVEGTQTVSVNDGRLTISNAAGSVNNRVAYVQITGVEEPPPPTGFSAKINFQPSGATAPAGYLVDAGLAYGDRGNGLTYGWAGGSNTAGLRDRNLSNSPDQRYDTLNHFNNRVWELAVPNGQYHVRIVAGDPGYFDSIYKIKAEHGDTIVDGTATSGSRWVEGNADVWVDDGKLSISNDIGAFNNKICFIEVTAKEDALPIVNVRSSSIIDAFEDGPALLLSFHRNADIDQPLTVYYTIGGSATNGADYETLTSPLTFAAGEVVTYLPVTLIDDPQAEETETLTLTLAPHDGYVVGNEPAATVRILDDDTVPDGFSARINFQPASAPVPEGYFPFSGGSFQSRENGLVYGYVGGGTSAGPRDRNAISSPDQRYDTLTHLGTLTWELAVPNGKYNVRIVAGDPSYFDGVYHITAEGASVVNAAPTSANRWIDGSAAITVSDGELTITSGAGAVNNKICFIDVTQLEASAGNTITWTTRASNPIARAEALRAVVDGKLHVFGGFQGDGPSRRHDVFDPAANTWTRLADLPTRLSHAGVAVDGTNIYVAGGYVGTAATGWAQKFGVTNVWKYSLNDNAWTAVTPLPKEVAGGGMVLLGRKLHWISGNNNQRQDIGDHYVLDLDNTASGWQTAAPLPFGRSHLGVVALGGKIYAVGGQFGNDSGLTTQKYVHSYDPATNAWTRLADMQTAIGHIASATFVMGNRIVTAGGETAHGAATDLVYAYDVTTNSWTSMTPLPAKRFSGVAAEIGGDIYFTTGSTQTTTWKGVVS
jgi:N-acetylneuraminic acid mutarotase